ncbi:MAG TPA: rhomboid family intramembrane serine protease [Capillimicrobium sp.]|nr:rhomboid family intramembrane serine protease [Capillimicrobium sp.]
MSSDQENGLAFVAVIAALMWVAEVVDLILGGDLDAYGIEPQEADGLVGVATAPFLHAGFGHLVGNTIPFLLLGATIALAGLARVVWVTVVVALTAGFGTWATAPPGTVHIGASGVVFGYASYLVSRAFFSRSLVHAAVGIVVIALYGGTVLFGMLPERGISWQGHLFGALGGVLAAWLLERRRPTPAPSASA